MALVKVIRHGQITIPKELREKLGIREGDLLEVEASTEGLRITPKTTVNREVGQGKFWDMVEQLRASVRDADPEEVDAALSEAVKAAKRATAKKSKAR